MKQLNKSLVCMIRGKSVEEAIRFSFMAHKDRLSIPAAQNYANDLYYLRTKGFSPSVVKFNAKPINTLVKAGINLFTRMGIKCFKNLQSYEFVDKNGSFYVFPDFVPKKLTIEKKSIKNCCLELKISSSKKQKISKKHILQCYRYSTKSRKPVILLYLFFSKKLKKKGIYEVFPKFFIIFNNELVKFQI